LKQVLPTFVLIRPIFLRIRIVSRRMFDIGKLVLEFDHFLLLLHETRDHSREVLYTNDRRSESAVNHFKRGKIADLFVASFQRRRLRRLRRDELLSVSQRLKEKARELTVSPGSTLRSSGKARKMFTSAICSFSSVRNVVLSSLSSSTFDRNVSNSSMKLVGTAAVSATREARMIACCPTMC